MKKNRFLFFVLPPVLGLFLAWEIGALRGRPARSGSQDFDLLQNVMMLIKSDYVEEKNPVETMDGALKGLLNSLDPASCYLDRRMTGRYLEIQKAEARDTGLVVYKAYGGFPQVLLVQENSPAAKNGIKAGDVITELEGRSAAPMSLTEAALYLKDGAGTPVKLKVIRETDTMDLSVERTFRLAQAASLKPVRIRPEF